MNEGKTGELHQKVTKGTNSTDITKGPPTLNTSGKPPLLATDAAAVKKLIDFIKNS